MEDVDERFSDLIRERMDDDEFWNWVRTWKDPGSICSEAEGWCVEDKIELIEEYRR